MQDLKKTSLMLLISMSSICVSTISAYPPYPLPYYPPYGFEEGGYDNFYGDNVESPSEALERNYNEQVGTMLQSNPNMDRQEAQVDAQAIDQQAQILQRSLQQQKELDNE